MTTNKTIDPAIRSSKRNKIIALCAALAVVGIGYALVMTKAAGFFVSIDPATSSLSGNITTVVDADGTKTIQYNTPIVTPPPPPPVTGDRVCPPFPAFPDENCAGIPKGTKVTESGSITTTSDGQVIDSKLVRGSITVRNNNVTIKNSRITGPIYYQMGDYADVKGLIIKDSDIGTATNFIGPVLDPLAGLVDGCPAQNNGGTRLIRGSDFTLLRSHVHHNGDDVISVYGTAKGTDTVLIQDNILDKTCFYPEDHLDIVQLYDPGAVTKVNIVHNRMDARPANTTTDHGNAAIFWADDPGSGSRLTFYNNLFAGGNYTVYLLEASTGSGIVIDGHDNLFMRDTYTYGPCTSNSSNVFNGTSGLKWSNNKFTDGTAISC